MPYALPSLSFTEGFLVALFKALLPDRDVGSERSFHRRRLKVIAAATTQIHSHVDAVSKDVMPDTAGDNGPIDRWGSILGVPRKSATPARKTGALRVRGTLAATITLGDELIHVASGLRFQVNENEVIPAALFVDVDIVALDTGSATRLDAGEVLEFVSTPPGLETQATLVLDVNEDGYDREQYGAYRNRVLAAFSEPTAGGNQSDFEAWAKELSTIAAAYVYPNRAGFGTIDVAAFHAGTGTARFLAPAERAELLAYLKTKAPAQLVGGALRVLETVANAQGIEVTVTASGDPAYAFHWDDSIPLVVLSWTAGTRTLRFTTARPASMQAGHGIVLRGVASVQDGAPLRIESLASTDSVVLEVAPAVAPAATDVAYSGGPLVAPIRDALIGHINGEIVYAGDDAPIAESDATSLVALKVLADPIGPANPAGYYGSWSGAIVRAAIVKIATYARGVRNAAVIDPATDFEATDPAFPLDSQVGIIVPPFVLVRRG